VTELPGVTAETTAGPYGFLGPEGSFAHAAALALAGAAELTPYATVSEAVDAVRAATAAGAVVPLENSVEGSVPATLDELAELTGRSPLVIAAETHLPVVFDLLARPGARLAELSTVATHPHAAAQVRRYLLTELPGATVLPVDSTAAGARAVATAWTPWPMTSPTTRGRSPASCCCAPRRHRHRRPATTAPRW